MRAIREVGVSVCDIACGLNAYTLILEALLEREQTGVGASIKISLFDSLSEWMNVPYLQYVYTKKAPKRVVFTSFIVLYACFVTKDNTNILFSIQNEREVFEEIFLNYLRNLKKNLSTFAKIKI